jgi:hypothetical protein
MLAAVTKNIVAHGMYEVGGGYYLTQMSISKAVQVVRAIKPLDIEWRPKGGSWHNCRSSLSGVVNVFVESGMGDVKPLELDNFNSIAS